MDRLRRSRQLLWTALVVPVLLLRALLPTGYMPGPGGLMLCPGTVPVQQMPNPDAQMVVMDMSGMDMSGMDAAGLHHHPPAQHHTEGHSEVCPFAAGASGYAPAAADTLVLAGILVESPRAVARTSGQHAPTILRTQGPRGPPTLATV